VHIRPVFADEQLDKSVSTSVSPPRAAERNGCGPPRRPFRRGTTIPAATANPPSPRAVGRRLSSPDSDSQGRSAVLQRESSAPHGASLFQEGRAARPRQRRRLANLWLGFRIINGAPVLVYLRTTWPDPHTLIRTAH